MQVSPFEFDAPAGGAAEAGDPDRSPEMRASPDSEDDDRQEEDAMEEPGYGHGV